MQMFLPQQSPIVTISTIELSSIGWCWKMVLITRDIMTYWFLLSMVSVLPLHQGTDVQVFTTFRFLYLKTVW